LAELRHSNGDIYAATTGYSFSRNTSVERSVPPFTAATPVGDSAHSAFDDGRQLSGS